MADNTVLNLGADGDVAVTREISHAGDTAKLQGVFAMGISGSEGSYTAAAINGDATNGLDVDVTRVSGGGVAHDAAATSQNPLTVGGYASAAAPTDVSADGDAVRAWMLRNGAQATVLTAAGALVGGDATNGLDVDVTRVGGNVTVVGAAAEDAAASGNPVLIGGRYDSSARTLETGDAGAIALNASGQVLVEIAAGAGSGGTAAADDADFTAGTTSGTPVMGVYESSPTSVTDGDLGTVGITQTRAMKVAIASGGIAGAVVDSVAGATDEGVLAVAVRDDALATLTPVDGDYTQLRTNARGAQWVALDSTAAQTVTLAAGTATNEIVGDVAQDAAISGNPVSVGLRASTAIPTAMSADGDSVYGWADLNGAVVVAGRIVDDAAFTPGTSRVHPIAFQADETATDSVDEGDAGCPRMTLDRKVIVTPYAHAAAGGHTPFKSLDLDESEEEVKASGGKLFWVHAINLAATKRYLKIYNNTAAGTTVGTTVPDLTFPIPTLGDTNGAGFAIHFGEHGIALGTGITIAATTGFADNDTGAPGANEVIVNLGFL